MKIVKNFFYLVKCFGFTNAVKLIKIFKNKNWYLFNWWLYIKSVSETPINLEEQSYRWDAVQYNWHDPTSEDFDEIMDFIKTINEPYESK